LINALRIVRGNAKDLTLPEVASEEYVNLARRIGYVGDDETVRKKFEWIWDRYREIAKRLYKNWMKQLQESDWAKLPEDVTGLEPQALRISLDDILTKDLDAQAEQVMSQLGFQDIPMAQNCWRRICPNTLSFEPFALVMDQAWSFWRKIPDPQLAITNLGRFIEALENTELFWQKLADEPDKVFLFFYLFGSSKYLSNVLINNPHYWTWISQEDEKALERTHAHLTHEADSVMDFDELRVFRHRETLRIALAESYFNCPLEQVYIAYSELADFVLRKVFDLCFRDKKICIGGFGKLGAKELNFSSDIDLLFINQDESGPGDFAAAVQEFLNQMKKGGPEEFLYRVDLRLRPHGEGGSLTMGLSDTIHYYQKDAQDWELQALMKFRPIAGTLEYGEELLKQLNDRLYRPCWEPESLANIRDMKRQYEQMVRDKKEEDTNIKLGPGTIRDIEFAVQMTQLLGGCKESVLQSPHTLTALESIQKKQLLSPEECGVLKEGYLFFRRIENRLQLFENRQEFNIPKSPRRLSVLAKSMGFDEGSDERNCDKFIDIFRGQKRACRAIFERVFYGEA